MLLGHIVLHDIALVLDHLSLLETRKATALSARQILWLPVELAVLATIELVLVL